MHDLIPLGPAALPALGTLTDAEIDATMAYGAAEKALATRAAYLSDWRDFAAWCALRGATALPAHQGIVAAYLSWLADSGRKASTIGRRAAAIGYHHKIAGHEPPTNQEGVKAVLRGIRRTIGAAAQGKAPATADVFTTMLALCPGTLAGHRDRALLALGFAGAFRRSELVALDVEDLTEVPDGLRVRIRRSKTDQEGEGAEVAILRLPAPPGRGGADMAGRRRDQQRARVPCRGPRRTGIVCAQRRARSDGGYPAHIAAQRIQGLVAADLRQLPDRGAALGRRREEPAAQAVAGIGGRIKADPPRIPLHDPGRAVVRQGLADLFKEHAGAAFP